VHEHPGAHAEGGVARRVGRRRGERDPEDATAHLPTDWDLFGSSGRFLGSGSVPSILVSRVDYVAGIETDALGVRYAVVYDLVRSG